MYHEAHYVNYFDLWFDYFAVRFEFKLYLNKLKNRTR